MSNSLIQVRQDDLTSPEVQALIAEHLAGMQGCSPSGCVNALALDGLRNADITFLTAWSGTNLCGCGALKHVDATSGEIKSMRTRERFLRKGVGQAILDEIVRIAKARDYVRLLLETGTGAAFEAAHAMYSKNDFTVCGPFGSYTATEFNIFMVKNLRHTA